MTSRRLAALLQLTLLLPVPLAAQARAGATAPRDDLDRIIQQEMTRRRIPGLSIAVFQDGQVVLARGYGLADVARGTPVTPATLFQAGSISKSVAATGALHLVEQGKLSLDADVNTELRSWKVPDNRYTSAAPVTLRRILSHSAGLTVHGFPGYDVDDREPSLVQVLDGAPPANTAPIRVDTVPGTLWRYSGGGYTVMQQMIIDRTGQPFPRFMQRTVLGPLGMRSSSYQQPPTGARATLTAAGYYADQTPVHGRWHVYPEMAAAGLWTTPTDLARFAIGLQATYAGRSHRVLTPAMARQMLTDQINGDGLGVFLQGHDSTLQFSHSGRDEGFDALLVGWAATGQGVAIMINANDDSRMMRRILRFLSRRYHWPDQPSGSPPPDHPAPVSAGLLDSLAGRYELQNNFMVTFVAQDTVLATLADGLPDEIYYPTAAGGFVSSDGTTAFTVQRDAGGAVSGLTWTDTGRERSVPRIGPLIAALPSMADPDPAVTARAERALHAIDQGGQALATSTDVTEGVRHDFAGGFGTLKGLSSVSFIAIQDVAGRGIERHGSPVARIGYYRLATTGGERTVLVHFTEDGLVTDIDLVER